MARPPHGRRPVLDADEQRLFAEAMRGVRPLKGKGAQWIAPPTKEDERREEAEVSPPRPGADLGSLATVERWGEHYTLVAAGVDRKTVRALKGGEPAAI